MFYLKKLLKLVLFIIAICVITLGALELHYLDRKNFPDIMKAVEQQRM